MSTLLLNPKKHNRYYPDEHSKDLMLKTIRFFEDKGKRRLKDDDRNCVWYADFLEFQKKQKLFANLLTPQPYGNMGCRWDTWRKGTILLLNIRSTWLVALRILFLRQYPAFWTSFPLFVAPKNPAKKKK